jgi:hypothetical protein
MADIANSVMNVTNKITWTFSNKRYNPFMLNGPPSQWFQIAIVRIEYIGSAHTEADLKTLFATASQHLLGDQLIVFAETIPRRKISLKNRYYIHTD